MISNKNCAWVWVLVVALCVAACLSAAHAASSVTEGLYPNATVMAPPPQPTKLPEFEFANLHGGALKSSELKGRVLIIRFWATW